MAQYTLANISKRLTGEVVEKCFKIKTNSDDSVNVTRAAAVGEGLISAVFRIQVKGFHNEASFVAKGLVRDPLLRKSLRCARYFEREITFFSKILPLLIEVQKSSGAKERIQENIPVCYAFHAGDDDDYILMENLAEKGFASISTIPGLIEKELTLKTLAHMHAVSFALRAKRPNDFNKVVEKLPELYYSEDNRVWYGKFLRKAMDINCKIMMEYENPSSIYYKKFMDINATDIYQQLMDLSSNDGDFPVLNHGDAWLPNFLCSEQKTMAIDFQLLRCSSLVTDLTMFLTLCSNTRNTKEDFNKSIETYYHYLKYYLEDMGMDARDIYSWDDLISELKKYGRFGLLASMTSIPLLASERCDVQKSFNDKFADVDRIPLEELWVLNPFMTHEQKMVLVNAVRVAVDVGLV